MVVNRREPDGITRIRVVGVGGGGSNAVSRMFHERITGIEYQIANTDTQIAHLNVKDRYLVERLTTINSTAGALQNFYLELIM